MNLLSSSPILHATMLLLTGGAVCMGAEEKTEPTAAISITDTAALKAHVGKRVSISGMVSRVGMSKSGFIVFINFEGVLQGGFSAVVKSASLPEIESVAGANLDAALPGRRIALLGVITLYKEAPQIELKTADQIKVGR